MADNARPPFRADHVGSLLRPKQVLQAREEFAAGQISAEQLAQVEDAAILDIIRMQREVGLKTATDGEFRRQSWHMDFIYQLGGITKVNDDTIRVAFHSKDKNFEYTPPSAHVTAPVLFLHGGQDRVAPSSHAEWLAGRCPSAQLRLYPEDGHISVLDSAATALDWLAEQADPD